MHRFFLFLALLGSPGFAAQADTKAAAEGIRWEASTPEEQGLDSKLLLQALERVRDENLDVHSVILIRNGRVVLECYVHPYDRETLHNVKSVSKSVISAVTGVALEKGVIENLDRTVHGYLPQHFGEKTDPRKKNITLRHLLTMTSGLDLDENGPIMNSIFGTDDWIQAAFARPMVAEPGERFVYSTTLTHTMSAILTEAGGKGLLDLATEYLFDPLDFGEVQWTRGPRGYYFGGAELFLTPRDMAKFGLLFLNRGRWQEKQLVSEVWVDRSTRDQLAGSGHGRPYGYWWWPDEDDGYSAIGWGGQVIAVKPRIGMVAVTTAADPNASQRMFRGFDDFKPGEKALPPNPEALQDLRRLAEKLEHPKPAPVPRLPGTAKKISGIEYEFEANPQGFRSLALEFPGGKTARMTVDMASGAHEFQVGLDGLFRLTGTGAFGHMPRDNRIALRGSWIADDAFTIESHEMGNPMVSTTVLRFKENLLDVKADVRPAGIHYELTATRKPAEQEKAEDGG